MVGGSEVCVLAFGAGEQRMWWIDLGLSVRLD